MSISDFVTKEANKDLGHEPVFFDLSDESDQAKLQDLVDAGKVNAVVDDYLEQLDELFGSKNPTKAFAPEYKDLAAEYVKGLEGEMPLWQHGKWVLFPWLSKVVHILDDEDYQFVRTSRNKNLITAEEQEKFYNSTIGVGGLSVGSSILLAIVMGGGAKNIKIADMDVLALSNMNRIRSGVDNLGVDKTAMAARQIYEINPYATVEIFNDGITEDNIEDFMVGKAKLDIMIDEMDNLAIKYLIRVKCKEHRIPVIMAADNGDSGVIDIDRFDLDENTPFFHGRLGDHTYESLQGMQKMEIGKTIAGMVGLENHTEPMLKSLTAMGKEIVSWPQLGGTAMLNGAAMSYLVRRILNGYPTEDNRAIIDLDKFFIPDYDSEENKAKRAGVSATFAKIFGMEG